MPSAGLKIAGNSLRSLTPAPVKVCFCCVVASSRCFTVAVCCAKFRTPSASVGILRANYSTRSVVSYRFHVLFSGIFVARLKRSPGHSDASKALPQAQRLRGTSPLNLCCKARRSHVITRERIFSLSGRTWPTACWCNLLLGLRKTSGAWTCPPRSKSSRCSNLKPNGPWTGSVSTNAIANVQRHA